MRRAAAPLLAVALAASGCSGESSSSPETPSDSSSSATPTPPPEPVVGECHQLGFAQAADPDATTDPVPCQGPHSSETVKVGRLDTLLAEDEDEVDVESGPVRDRVAQACSPRLLRYAGGDQVTRRLSRLEVVWFTPSTEAAEAGASWFRCDIVGIAADNKLVRLPRTVKGVLDAPDALDTLGTCGTKAPGKPGFSRVVCRRTHTWRAVDTIEIDRRARYLGRVAAAQGDTACQDVAAARAGGALKYTWSFEWPTRQQWDTGQRYGYCWVPA